MENGAISSKNIRLIIPFCPYADRPEDRLPGNSHRKPGRRNPIQEADIAWRVLQKVQVAAEDLRGQAYAIHH